MKIKKDLLNGNTSRLKIFGPIIFIIIVYLFISHSNPYINAGEIHIWEDDNGIMNITEKPPPGHIKSKQTIENADDIILKERLYLPQPQDNIFNKNFNLDKNLDAVKPTISQSSKAAIPEDFRLSAKAYKTIINKVDDAVLILDNGAIVEIKSGYLSYDGYGKDAVLYKIGNQWKNLG